MPSGQSARPAAATLASAFKRALHYAADGKTQAVYFGRSLLERRQRLFRGKYTALGAGRGRFVMRLNKRKHLPAGLEHAAGGRQYFFLRRPCNIYGGHIHGFGQSCENCVGAFHNHDAGVFAQLPGQRAVAGVYGVYAGCAALQQTVAKAPYITTQVGDGKAGNGNTKRLDGGGEFAARARNKTLHGFAGRVFDNISHIHEAT